MNLWNCVTPNRINGTRQLCLLPRGDKRWTPMKQHDLHAPVAFKSMWGRPIKRILDSCGNCEDNTCRYKFQVPARKIYKETRILLEIVRYV